MFQNICEIEFQAGAATVGKQLMNLLGGAVQHREECVCVCVCPAPSGAISRKTSPIPEIPSALLPEFLLPEFLFPTEEPKKRSVSASVSVSPVGSLRTGPDF